MKFAAHALTALLASCGCHSQANTEVQPNAALIVFPDASSVRYSVGAGTVVEYVVTMAFPAEEALASISRSLAATGWHPSRMDLLNPTIESSHVRGWSRFVDRTRGASCSSPPMAGRLDQRRRRGRDLFAPVSVKRSGRGAPYERQFARDRNVHVGGPSAPRRLGPAEASRPVTTRRSWSWARSHVTGLWPTQIAHVRV